MSLAGSAVGENVKFMDTHLTANKRAEKPLFSGLQPANAWLAILGFVVFSGVCAFAGFGKVLNFAFPGGAFLVGLFLYFRYPILYVGFCWWIWFLAPLVRRYADFRSGFTEPSPILLAPYFVTLISLVTILRSLPTAKRRGSLPFLLSLSGVVYGFLVGVIKVSLVSASVRSLEWLAPIVLGHHLFINWRDYPEQRQNIQTVFLWGVLITGSYGVYQYLVAPEWDTSWLINTDLRSAGTPEPQGLRVWSTMHGPGVFASVMMAGLLLLLTNVKTLGFPAMAVGYLSFLLSLVRSLWLGWLVGLLNLAVFLKPKFQVRLVVIIAVAALCVVPLTVIEPFSEVISGRIDSLSNLEGDTSSTDRQATYQTLLGPALTNVIGDGIKSGEIYDSAILETLISLGWIGSTFYVSGLLLLLLRLVGSTQIRGDSFASTARAITIAMFSQVLFGSSMLGLPGMILWGFMGIGLAAQKFYDRPTSST